MILKDIVQDSILMCDANISWRSLNRTISVVKHNKDIYEKFKKVIFIFNFNDFDYNYSDFKIEKLDYAYNDSTIRYAVDTIKNTISNSIILLDVVNRGWQFGAMDLAKIGYDYIKFNYSNIQWIVKTATDTLINDKIFNINLDNTDFVGIPFAEPNMLIEIAQRFNNKNLLKLMLENFDSPLKYSQVYQTTFYIFKNNKFDYLYYKNKFLRELWKKWLIYKKNNNDISIDKRFGLQVETFMLNSIMRNGIKTKMIFNDEDYIYFLNLFLWIIDSKIPLDASLKNINIEDLGITHWHPDQTIFLPIKINFKNRTFKFENIRI